MFKKIMHALFIAVITTVVTSIILHIGLNMPTSDTQSWVLESTGFIAVFAFWRIIKIFEHKKR